MRVEIRYYKRFDPDLLSLLDAGVDLNAYLPEVLRAYAHGEEYHLFVPFSKNHDLNGQQHIHTRVTVTDRQSIELLQKVKHGYRNTFCKILLREALVYQNFGVFFADRELVRKENIRVHSKDLSGIPNLVIAAVVKPKASAAAKVLGRGAPGPETGEKKDAEKKTVPAAAEVPESVPEGPSLQEQRKTLLKKLSGEGRSPSPAEQEDTVHAEPVPTAEQENMFEDMDEIPSFEDVEKGKKEKAVPPDDDPDAEFFRQFTDMLGL